MQETADLDIYDSKLPSDVLGFVLPSGPIVGDIRLLSDEDIEKALSDNIRQKALVNVDILSEKLMYKAVDPTASATLIANALDANYKLSGLAAKQIQKELPTQVSITINGVNALEAPVITIEQVVTDVVEEPIVLLTKEA